jgi:signal transduction histidine kinase
MRDSIPKVGRFCAALIIAILLQAVAGSGEENRIAHDLATNVSQLRGLLGGNMGFIGSFRLEGAVLAVDPNSEIILFQDDSGAEILEIGPGERLLKPGHRICLQGTGYVKSTPMGISLGRQPLIDIDGQHSEVECAATLDLKAGRHPIEVKWFNDTGARFFSLTYSGPGFGRREIPDSALFRMRKGLPGRPVTFENGLHYRCFEGVWQRLPPFEKIQPIKTGTTATFDLNVRTRNEHVGLVFDGFLQVASSGRYTFYLRSDDGSQLSINKQPIHMTMIGQTQMPEPKPVAVGQPLIDGTGAFWAEVEGKVTFVGRRPSGLELELASEDSRMRLLACDATKELPPSLLGARVRIRGACLNSASQEGHKAAGTFVILNWKNVQLLEAAPDFWSANPCVQINEGRLRSEGEVVCLGGKFRFSSTGELPKLEDGTGSIFIELFNAPPARAGMEVECTGFWNGSSNTLRAAVWRPRPKLPDGSLPLMTTAIQIQQLKQAEAKRGYPVKLRGVVTWLSEWKDGIVLQDSTRGIFVWLNPAWIWDPPQIGENLEIEGVSQEGVFAPAVTLKKGRRLGPGRLPAPLHPTWDQLIDGSMDTQYVEIRGFVTRTGNGRLTLLLPGRNIEVELYPISSGFLDPFLHSVVRVRGCAFAKWDATTLQVTLEHPLWIGNATICVDTPPPRDPFKADQMRADELTRYDVQRNFFRRVKVSGQYLQNRAGTYYASDDGFGFRFQPMQPVHLDPGDVVEISGLVELGGSSPVLREAVARKTGHRPLPAAEPLALDRVGGPRDSTRVWVEGSLLDAQNDGSEQVLQMQSGSKNFAARLPANGPGTPSWQPGSRLKLTGVFSDLDSLHSGESPGANSFALLLDSPGDIELIARPPWWTLGRLLAMMAVLATGLVLASIWISLLRRQVEHRTAQLKREISSRQLAEQARAVEQERSRIARDMHDELGAELAQIGLLADSGSMSREQPLGGIDRTYSRIAQRARNVVGALDEIVWAVDPRNDNLTRLADYLCQMAEECFEGSAARLRKDVPTHLPSFFIRAEARHHLTLAVKEAFTNILKHSHASEVWLRLVWNEPELMINVEDNGCGFARPGEDDRGNGLGNQRVRMERIGGVVELESKPGGGTRILFRIKLEMK